MMGKILPLRLLRYVLRFLLFFAVFYYGSYAVIGVSAPGGKYYSEGIARYANYPAWLRTALLQASAGSLRMLGHETVVEQPYKVRIRNGRGVKVVYSCLGIGLLSFWLAFILANETTIRRRLLFGAGGMLGIFLINVGRMVMLVLAANGYWRWRTDADHHTLFNIACYVLILSMMLLFDRSERRRISRLRPSDDAPDVSQA